MTMFQKATKRAVRARIALDGPSGSGKTWTALTWAHTIGGRVAAVDTERASMALYSDRFDFDVIEMSPPFHPDRLIEAIRAAEKAGYNVLVIDSLSHFWEGEGGVLDLVDAAGARAKGNTYAGWKAGTPVLRHLIDTILASDLHVIVTMRSKTEYVLETNNQGKQVPVKVGMAPVMRAGMEYEFTLVGDLDLEHRLTISKSRADVLADKVIQPGRAHEAAEAFMAWINAGSAMATREQIDALKQSFNGIGDSDTRRAAKKAFADQFGNPDYLVAEKLDEARSFVQGYISVDAETPPAEATSIIDSIRQTLPAAQQRPPAEAPRMATTKEAQGIHIDATRAHMDEDTLRVIVFANTGGMSDSTKDLDEISLGRVKANIDRWAQDQGLPSNFDDVAEQWATWKRAKEQQPDAVAS